MKSGTALRANTEGSSSCHRRTIRVKRYTCRMTRTVPCRQKKDSSGLTQQNANREYFRPSLERRFRRFSVAYYYQSPARELAIGAL